MAMKWAPVVKEGGTLPPELAKMLRKWGITGHEQEGGTFIMEDTPEHYYIQGLAAAGIEGATLLDSALTKYGRIRVISGDLSDVMGDEDDEEA